MISRRHLRCYSATLLLVAVHLSMVAVLYTLTNSCSDNPVILNRYSLTLGSVLAVLAAVLILSVVCLASRPAKYRGFLTSIVERFGVLPEILLITVLFTVAFLLFVGGLLTPLMDRSLFAGGIITLLVSTALLPPMLMSHERWTRFRGRITSFLIGLVISLLIAEISLRLLVKSSIYHPSLDLRPNIRMEMRNSAPGVSPICIHTTNSLGLRGDEPPEDWEEYFTILTVGGSTTHCFYMDDRTTWPYLLQEDLRERNLRVWVGNGGLDGHSTRGHILFMREVIPRLNPDMVVILCGINDLQISLKPNLMGMGVPAETARLGDRVYASSVLLQVITRWKQIIFEEGIVVSENLPYRFIPIPLDSTESPLPSDLRLVLPELTEFASNVRTIIGMGREAGVDMVFLTQPLLFEDKPYWRNITNPSYSIEATGTVYSCATIWNLLDIYNAELLAICREEDIPCFDLARALGHDSVYFCDEMHFSEAGTREVARLLSEFMIEENLVPLPQVQN